MRCRVSSSSAHRPHRRVTVARRGAVVVHASVARRRSGSRTFVVVPHVLVIIVVLVLGAPDAHRGEVVRGGGDSCPPAGRSSDVFMVPDDAFCSGRRRRSRALKGRRAERHPRPTSRTRGCHRRGGQEAGGADGKTHAPSLERKCRWCRGSVCSSRARLTTPRRAFSATAGRCVLDEKTTNNSQHELYV